LGNLCLHAGDLIVTVINTAIQQTALCFTHLAHIASKKPISTNGCL
jgi:hypothetical protein